MSVFKFTTAVLTLVTAVAGLPAVPAAATRVQAGSLTCDISAGFGIIVGSKRDIDCIFTPSTPGQVEHYRGTITKIGVDIGVLRGGSLIWYVYAPTNHADGVLQGSYSGVSANATVGLGLGTNVLYGGLDGSVALQPLSIEGTSGLNVAAGIANMKLIYEPPPPPKTKPTKHQTQKHMTQQTK
jgi:hypothetical protein